jgi:hypothetical protein
MKFGASRDNKMNALQDGVAIAAKVFGGTTSSYAELSPEEVAALKAAKKEAEAGKKEEEVISK